MNSNQRSATISFVYLAPTLTEPQRGLVEAIYRRHHGALVAYATARLGDALAAEDVVQEAFLEVVSSATPFPAVDPLNVLRAVVRKRCARLKRVLARREATKLREEVRGWRAWRSGMRSRHDPRHDEEEEER